LQAAENVRDGLITEGFSIQLRNAEAHTSYKVQEWGVRILRTDGGTTDISTEELVDSVLAGVETLQGIYFGTVCALANAGIDLEELPDADVWKLTTDHRIRLVLATFQWNDVTIRRVAERLVVEGTGEFPLRPLSLAGACLASLKTEATIFELRGSQGQIEGPIEPMVEHELAIDGLQREAAFVKCARLWTFDGEPVLSREHVRKWVAMQAGRALGHTYAGRDLKVLRHSQPRWVIPTWAIRSAPLSACDEHATSVFPRIQETSSAYRSSQSGRSGSSNRSECWRPLALDDDSASREPDTLPSRMSHPSFTLLIDNEVAVLGSGRRLSTPACKQVYNAQMRPPKGPHLLRVRL
jgi:hypothetical protein